MYGKKYNLSVIYWTLDGPDSPARRICGLHFGDIPSAMPIPITNTMPSPTPNPTPRPMFISFVGLSTPIVGERVGEKDGPDGLGVGTKDGADV